MRRETAKMNEHICHGLTDVSPFNDGIYLGTRRQYLRQNNVYETCVARPPPCEAYQICGDPFMDDLYYSNEVHCSNPFNIQWRDLSNEELGETSCDDSLMSTLSSNRMAVKPCLDIQDGMPHHPSFDFEAIQYQATYPPNSRSSNETPRAGWDDNADRGVSNQQIRSSANTNGNVWNTDAERPPQLFEHIQSMGDSTDTITGGEGRWAFPVFFNQLKAAPEASGAAAFTPVNAPQDASNADEKMGMLNSTRDPQRTNFGKSHGYSLIAPKTLVNGTENSKALDVAVKINHLYAQKGQKISRESTRQISDFSAESHVETPIIKTAENHKQSLEETNTHSGPITRHWTSQMADAKQPADSCAREAKDEFLVKSKLSGMSYKDIKIAGQFSEAESTLRGRFRALTKPKDSRLRRPQWTGPDVSAFHFSSSIG